MSSLALLVGIADHGSLSAGARSVGMAQSNATRAVKTLERRLGFPLLSRATTGSKLTQEGTLVVEWAREALQSLNTLWTGAQALAAPADREFTFAASMTVAEHLAPTWIGRLHEVDPRIKTKLRVMNSREVIAAVNNRDVALGFVETPDVPPQLSSATVWTDELVLIAPPGHPWATRREPVTLRELAATHLVEREAGSGTRAFLDERVGAARATPDRGVQQQLGDLPIGLGRHGTGGAEPPGRGRLPAHGQLHPGAAARGKPGPEPAGHLEGTRPVGRARGNAAGHLRTGAVRLLSSRRESATARRARSGRSSGCCPAYWA